MHRNPPQSSSLIHSTNLQAAASATYATSTATANENLGNINVTNDATLTISAGVTVTSNDAYKAGIRVADGVTLTIVGPNIKMEMLV